MARRPSNIVHFPGAAGVVITEAEYELLTSVVGPYYGAGVSAFLGAAPVVPGGRRINTNSPAIDELLDAIGCEVHGYMKLDEERTGKTTTRPTRGSTAHQLLTVYDRIEGHRS